MSILPILHGFLALLKAYILFGHDHIIWLPTDDSYGVFALWWMLRGGFVVPEQDSGTYPVRVGKEKACPTRIFSSK
jgi:hypothetical protein